jgi:hypothetical protein
MDSDSYGEMHRLPFRDTPLNDETADRLLSGRLPALDAPEPYRGLASLFEAAAGAPTPQETAQGATVIAAAMAAMEAATPVHSAAKTPISRRRSMLSKLLTAKAAAAATVAALGLGTAAAAATGALPIGTTNSHSSSGLAIATSSSSGTNSGNSKGHANNSGTNSTGAANNQNAQFGLCTAFLAHHPASVTPATSVPSDNSKTFSALISNHTDLAGTIAYCQTVMSTTTTHAGPGDSTDNNGTDNNSGKPADAGKPSSTPPVSTPNSGGTGTADTASGESSSTGTGTAGTSSNGASGAGSGNPTGH